MAEKSLVNDDAEMLGDGVDAALFEPPEDELELDELELDELPQPATSAAAAITGTIARKGPAI